MMRGFMSIGLVLVLIVTQGVNARPLLEPVLDSDMVMRADRATLIEQDGSKLLVLEGDVSVSIGGFGFRDQQAIVRIKRRDVLGDVIRDFAIVFKDPTADGEGGVKADGQGLLVTVANRGKVQVSAELGKSSVVPDSAFTRAALARIAEYDQRLAQPLLPVPPEPPLTPEQLAKRDARQEAIRNERRTIELPDPSEVQRDAEIVERPVLPAKGTVRYGSVDRIVYQRGEDEDAVILIGGVRVLYQDVDAGRDVLLTAERIVIFVDKDDEAVGGVTAQVDAGRVRGVYLEDSAVVSDGSTTVRAPRAFYDLKTNRAILLDAVVYSYDMRRRVPLYMRADVIRQTSADTFSANDATFTTSEFGKPHLSIGASRITLQRVELEDGETENWVTADDLTVDVGDRSLFYWPTATLEAGRIPIRRLRVGGQGNNGPQFESRWDVFALAGVRTPDGVDLTADLDVRGEHGIGIGANLEYDFGDTRGDFRGYVLPSDSGSDEMGRRNDVGFDAETRGFFRARHRQVLPEGWEAWFEASYVSDPTLLEEFFRKEAYADENYETSAFFKKAEDDWAFTALISGQTNNFMPQYAPLLTPGYAVNKLPEFEYRLITSVFEDTATLFHETRIGRMRAVFGNDSPADRGFTNAQSLSAFGFAAGTSFDDDAIARNFPRQLVTRLDSRTELAAPFRSGPVDVTPFAVARLTAYDDDFAQFNGGNDDQARLWGGLGTRISTQFSKTVGSVNSDLLDLQGIRHIIEPSVALAYYDNSIDAVDLPIYDPEVERLTEGGVTRLGLLNTWQTKRGGVDLPDGTRAMERVVDWIRLRTDVVLVSEDSPNALAIGRYYDYRPEYTLGDDHFYTELLWAVTEATAMTGDLTYGFDEGTTMQWHLGFENQHTDRLSTYTRYREIDAIDARLLSYGATLQLTSKYRAGLVQVLDFGQDNGAQLTEFTLDRRLPRATFGIIIGYDNIDGEATISFTLSPEGNVGRTGGGFFGGLR